MSRENSPPRGGLRKLKPPRPDLRERAHAKNKP